MSKTTIIQYSATGKITFKAEMPNHLTKREIRKECRKWKANYSKCKIIYS